MRDTFGATVVVCSRIAAARASYDELDRQHNPLTHRLLVFFPESRKEQLRGNASQLGYWLPDDGDRRMNDICCVKIVEAGYRCAMGNLYSHFGQRMQQMKHYQIIAGEKGGGRIRTHHQRPQDGIGILSRLAVEVSFGDQVSFPHCLPVAFETHLVSKSLLR